MDHRADPGARPGFAIVGLFPAGDDVCAGPIGSGGTLHTILRGRGAECRLRPNGARQRAARTPDRDLACTEECTDSDDHCPAAINPRSPDWLVVYRSRLWDTGSG